MYEWKELKARENMSNTERVLCEAVLTFAEVANIHPEDAYNAMVEQAKLGEPQKNYLAEAKEAREDGEDMDKLEDAIGDKAVILLLHAGFASMAALDDASNDELAAVKGVGDATVAKIRLWLTQNYV